MTQPAPVLAWITPAAPFGIDPPESPTERAAHAALMSVADFYIGVRDAKTVDEALRLHVLIEEVAASVEAVSRAALAKADALCGASR